eukprot:1424891-Rhodomonas_salina.1
MPLRSHAPPPFISHEQTLCPLGSRFSCLPSLPLRPLFLSPPSPLSLPSPSLAVQRVRFPEIRWRIRVGGFCVQAVSFGLEIHPREAVNSTWRDWLEKPGGGCSVHSSRICRQETQTSALAIHVRAECGPLNCADEQPTSGSSMHMAKVKARTPTPAHRIPAPRTSNAAS